ncbi:pantetheine-phosphate adenylyltransferase [Patescibacteria group bacterium]|nr:pantetheine-phosphate adenylyltransferase [Patescibacteria group bacterium]MBU1672940.1 pantetheine-phosphate adenylyltransferase [Patescibacteria group bacterium]MBU1963582.1 pantetheine-phosphate adenylyltransferase [Patescibacteria group bacterium]MBU1963585.1 pantetheine-phosphate adenylyltransferase [Patescibacteria group bacterium]
MKSAIYPFSADPIHNGHVNNIERILEMGIADSVLVAIGKNIEKRGGYLFSDKERLMISKQALKKFGGKVKVELFEGLLAHYAGMKKTNVIVRGLRNNLDFEKEQTMAEFNRSYGLETLMLPAPRDVFNISSTTIKEIVSNGGLVYEYVPAVAKQALEEKMQNITLIGVTGNTGSGKSTLCKKLSGVSVVDADKLIHKIYQISESVKEDLKKTFGGKIFKAGKVDRAKLAEIIFNDSMSRNKLVDILRIPFKIALEEAMKDMKGIVLLDCAYIVEYGLLPVVNNNVILTTCSEEEKIKRNKRARQILEVQMPERMLEQEIRRKQKEENYGNLLKVDTEKKINYDQIVKHLSKWRILPFSQK